MTPREEIEQRFAAIEHNISVAAQHAEAQTTLLKNVQELLQRIFWVVGIAVFIGLLLFMAAVMRH